MANDITARGMANQALNSINGIFVNVKDYGAKCDGVTDDTDAIQKAIDAISKSNITNGGEVIVPGISIISAKTNQLLSLPTGATYGLHLYNCNVTLRGVGHHSTLKASTINPPKYMVVMDSNYAGFGNRGGGVRDLKIDGKDLASYGLLIGGNYYSCVVQQIFRNLFITNTRRYGLVLDVTQNNKFELVQVENCGGCLLFTNGAGNNYFSKCEFNAAAANATLDGNGNVINGVSILENICFDMQKIDIDDIIGTTISSTSSSGQMTVNVTSTTGFSVNDAIVIGNISDNEEVAIITSIGTNAFNINKNLLNSHSKNEVVSKVNGALTTLSGNSTANQKVLNVASTSGFRVGNAIVVGSGTANEEIAVISSINTTNSTLTTNSNLLNTHSKDDVIVVAINSWAYNIFNRIPEANTISGRSVIERGKGANTIHIKYGCRNNISDNDIETGGNTDCGVKIDNNATTYNNRFYDNSFSGNHAPHSAFISYGFRTILENNYIENYNNTEFQLGNEHILKYNKTSLGEDPRVIFLAGDPASNAQYLEPTQYLSYNNVYDKAPMTSKRFFDINDRQYYKGRNSIQEYAFIDSSKILIMDDFFYQTFPTDVNTPWIRNKGSHVTSSLPSILSVVENGYLTLTSGSSSGTLSSDGTQIVSAFPITLQNKGFVTLETKLKVNSSINNVSINFGLTDSTSLQEPFTIGSPDAITSNATNAACFVYDGGSETKEWWTCSVDSGVLDSGSDRVAFLVEPCNTLWTSGNANVTSTLDTTDYKSDGNSVSLLVNSSFTTGLVGYKTFSASTSLHTYKNMEFWIKSSVALNAGDYQILLSTDTTCVTNIKEQINLPAIAANTWTLVRVTKPTYYQDGALWSVGLKQVVNKGVMTIKIDDIRNYNSYDILDNNQNPNDNYAPVSGIDQTLRIEFEPGHTYNSNFISTGFTCDGSLIRFYVNDVLVKTLKDVGISSSVPLYPTLIVNSTGAISGSVSVDYIKIYHSR